MEPFPRPRPRSFYLICRFIVAAVLQRTQPAISRKIFNCPDRDNKIKMLINNPSVFCSLRLEIKEKYALNISLRSWRCLFALLCAGARTPPWGPKVTPQLELVVHPAALSSLAHFSWQIELPLYGLSIITTLTILCLQKQIRIVVFKVLSYTYTHPQHLVFRLKSSSTPNETMAKPPEQNLSPSTLCLHNIVFKWKLFCKYRDNIRTSERT